MAFGWTKHALLEVAAPLLLLRHYLCIYTSQRQCFHHSTDTFPVITESPQQAPSLYTFESQFWAPFTINLSEGGIGRFGLVTVFVIALQALTSVAAFRDGGICRSPMLVRPSNDKTSFTEWPLDWRKASIHVVLGQPMRRVYKKRFCSSLAFRIKDIPS